MNYIKFLRQYVGHRTQNILNFHGLKIGLLSDDKK